MVLDTNDIDLSLTIDQSKGFSRSSLLILCQRNVDHSWIESNQIFAVGRAKYWKDGYKIIIDMFA